MTAESEGLLSATGSNGLSKKQLMFVNEYLAGKSQIEAARAAGYANPETNANKILRRPNVWNAIESARADIQKKGMVKAERVIEELSSVAFSDVRQLFSPDGNLLPPHEWPASAAAAIAGFDVVTVNKGEGAVEYVAKIKTWSKTDALDKLMRYLGAYQDKLQVTHDVSKVEQALHEGRQRVAKLRVVNQNDNAA